LITLTGLKPLKATMPSTTTATLDQISTEKTKLSERLARLDTERATVATQLTDLETAERVLTRVKTPPRGNPPRLPPRPQPAEAAGGREGQP
jgi:hypothetical protein